LLTEQAMIDIAHLLRPAHLQVFVWSNYFYFEIIFLIQKVPFEYFIGSRSFTKW
jgi:hypothetical protein